MNFIQKLAANLLVRKNTNLPNENLFYRMLYQFVGNSMPVVMDDSLEKYIEEALMYNPDVYAIISKVAKECAKVPIRFQELTSNGWDDVEDAEPLMLLKNPAPNVVQKEHIINVVAFYLATGNSYTYSVSPISGPNRGKPQELHVLPAQYTEIISSSFMEPVSGYKLNAWYGEEYEINKEDVIHIKSFNPSGFKVGNNSHLYGASPLQAARNLVRSSNDSYLAKMKLLQHVGAIGLLSGEPDKNQFSQFTQEQAQQLQDRMQEKYGGAENRGKMIITAAKLNWQQIGSSIVDLQINESLQNDFATLCDIYDVPIEVFSRSKSSTYNNKEQAVKQLYLNAVKPTLDFILEKYSAELIPKFRLDRNKFRFKADYSDIPELQENFKETAEALSKRTWWTDNEKREFDGKPLLDDEAANQLYREQTPAQSLEEAVKNLFK